jgi:hypothetical protein
VARNLDGSLKAALSDQIISPVVLACLTFKSGPIYVWSGVGDLLFNGNTYKGVGQLGKISSISEGSDVKADGMEVTLFGIGLSPFPPPAPPVVPPDVTPPVTVPPGQYVVYLAPSKLDLVQDPGYGGVAAGGVSPSGGFGSLDLADGGSFETGISLTYSGFDAGQIPDGAIINNAYATAQLTQGTDNDLVNNASFGITPGATGTFYYPFSTLPADINAAVFKFKMQETLVPPGGGIFIGPNADSNLTVSSLLIAVYYTLATASSLVNDAMADYLVGAPAKIYFGLISNGVLVGTPYLIFSGQIDQPTIDVSVGSSAITLALENKLSNLLRPTARRYTSGDQHIKYPSDSGFSWVEMLADTALRWGS